VTLEKLAQLFLGTNHYLFGDSVGGFQFLGREIDGKIRPVQLTDKIFVLKLKLEMNLL
jgi:hypothetical protein